MHGVQIIISQYLNVFESKLLSLIEHYLNINNSFYNMTCVYTHTHIYIYIYIYIYTSYIDISYYWLLISTETRE